MLLLLAGVHQPLGRKALVVRQSDHEPPRTRRLGGRAPLVDAVAVPVLLHALLAQRRALVGPPAAQVEGFAHAVRTPLGVETVRRGLADVACARVHVEHRIHAHTVTGGGRDVRAHLALVVAIRIEVARAEHLALHLLTEGVGELLLRVAVAGGHVEDFVVLADLDVRIGNALVVAVAGQLADLSRSAVRGAGAATPVRRHRRVLAEAILTALRELARLGRTLILRGTQCDPRLERDGHRRHLDEVTDVASATSVPRDGLAELELLSNLAARLTARGTHQVNGVESRTPAVRQRGSRGEQHRRQKKKNTQTIHGSLPKDSDRTILPCAKSTTWHSRHPILSQKHHFVNVLHT